MIPDVLVDQIWQTLHQGFRVKIIQCQDHEIRGLLYRLTAPIGRDNGATYTWPRTPHIIPGSNGRFVYGPSIQTNISLVQLLFGPGYVDIA